MADTHAHSRQSRNGRPFLRAWPLTIALVSVLVVGVGAFALAARASDARASATPTSSPTRAAPFTLGSVAPADGTTGVSSDATVTVAFTRPLATDSPTPTLTPPVAGTWQLVSPTTFAFVAAGSAGAALDRDGHRPGWPGRHPRGGRRRISPSPRRPTSRWRRAARCACNNSSPSSGYLPVGFTPTGSMVAPQEEAQPQEGTFAWRSAEPPRSCPSGLRATPT